MNSSDTYIKQLEEAIVPDLIPSDDNDSYKEKKPANILIIRLKAFLPDLLIAVFVFSFLFYIIYDIFIIAGAVYNIDSSMIVPQLYTVILPGIAFIVFLASTSRTWWNYHRQKLIFFSLCLLSLTTAFTKLAYCLINDLFVPILLKLPPNEDISKSMLLFLIRLLTILPTLSFFSFVTLKLLTGVLTSNARSSILDLRINIMFDWRRNKKYLYDINTVKRMSNGTQYTIKEKDRFLHMLINGSTGTGKTSSTLSVQIADDLDRRCINEDMMKKTLLKLIKKNKIYINQPFDNDTFNIACFSANEGYEKLLDKVKNKYKSCGITVVAPNSSLTDEVYNFCVNKGIACNRIDPIPENDGTLKPGWKGVNPLYISPLIPKWALRKEIIKKSTLFADVLQAVNELKGKGDPYFTSINRSITTSVSICLCMTFPYIYPGRQPTPEDIQSIVNDFSRITKFYNKLVEIDTNNDMEFVKDFIKNDMLGPGKDKMIEQSRGLRTIMNEFLTNPLIKQSVCCHDNIIDMDEMLLKGEVTVVNYALELGNTDSVAFGLFFVLSFIDAVLRRPGNERSRLLHFLCIDELPVLLHPTMERCFSLFRQYKCAMSVCIQSLDQMDKSEVTKYLKGVVMGSCAHHILFGRCSTSEMKIYSELAGTKWTEHEMTSVSENALSLEDTTSSFSTRLSLQLDNILEGSDIRNRSFQEVTMFSVVDGNIIEPFHGKVSFLSKDRYQKKKRNFIDWSKYYCQTEILRKVNNDVSSIGTITMKGDHVDETINDESSGLRINPIDLLSDKDEGNNSDSDGSIDI